RDWSSDVCSSDLLEGIWLVAHYGAMGSGVGLLLRAVRHQEHRTGLVHVTTRKGHIVRGDVTADLIDVPRIEVVRVAVVHEQSLDVLSDAHGLGARRVHLNGEPVGAVVMAL